jgi:hypothetical protein
MEVAMSYSEVADVRARMAQFTIGDSTKPTTTQAETFIEETDAEIDVLLVARGVSVPVTTPAAFLSWLGNVSANGATATVLKSMFPSATGVGETPAYAFFEKRYQDALKALRDGSVIPASLITEDEDSSEVSTYFTRNPVEEEDLGGISEPIFHVGHSF